MSQSSQSILDHMADFLKFISSAQSFWFTLNTSYDHGCHLASRFRLDPEDYEVVLPLVAPPSSRLIVPAGCRIASCRPLIASPFRRLVTPAGCRIASHHPLVAPPSRSLVAPACCRISSPRPLVAPPTHPLVASRRAALSSSRRHVVPPLVVSSCQLVVASSSLVVLSLHHLLILSS
jgi:hypothetical protein